MSHLQQLQSNFQRYLLQGQEQIILPEIAPDPRFSASNRLKVYFDAYRIRLYEILKLDFPKTYALFGDEDFEKVFVEYLDKHPSTHFSVRYFGQHLSEFLKTTTPYKNYPIFAEMAQFEWSLAYTLDAKDAPIITVADLSRLPLENWSTLRFTFHPSVISQYLYWDTPQLWREIDEEAPPRQPIEHQQGVLWLFWRKNLRCFFQSCSAIEEAMYRAVKEHKDFAALCESLIDILPEDEIPLNAAQTLHKWVAQEMITNIS